MKREHASSFERLRQEGWRIVDRWAHSVSEGPLPVPLGALAEAYKVREIVFEPLFSDAGIERDGDEFLICVNTEGRGVDHAADTELVVGRDDLDALSPPVRFSIAHEIAHLILLDVSGAKPESALFQKNLGQLEHTCNEMAGAILIPQSRLRRQISDWLFDAVHLRELSATYRVSLEAFLLRLLQLDMREELKAFDGLIVVAEGDLAVMEIRFSIVLQPLARQKWPRVADQRAGQRLPIELLGLPVDVLRTACDEEKVVMKLPVTWRENMVLPCALTMCRLYSRPLTILMAIQVIGPPERVSP